MTKRPKPIHMEPLRASVRRGPDAEGCWYWRVRQGPTTKTHFWASRSDALRTVAAMVAEGHTKPRAAATMATLGDVLEYWAGAQSERQDITPATLTNKLHRARLAKRAAGHVPCGRVGLGTLELIRDHLLGQGFAPTTTGQAVEVARAAWRWALRSGYVEGQPLPGLTVRDTRPPPHVPTMAEAWAVADRLHGWRRDMYLLILSTGARSGEISALTLDDVEGHVILGVHPGARKTGERAIPVGPAGQDAIDRLVADARAEPRRRLLPVRHGKAALSQALRRLDWASIGIKPFAPKALRSAAVSAVYGAGVDPGVAAKLFGHSPQTALKFYRAVRSQDMEAAVALAGLGQRPEDERKVLPFRRREEG